MLKTLQNMASLTQALRLQCDEDPMQYFSPTPPQEVWLRDASKVKLLRGGNQVGKSAAGIYETLGRCLGNHRYLQVPPPPIEAWAVVHSWEQSKVIQGKIHDMTPKHMLHPDCEYVRGKGYRGTGAPVIRYTNGSILRIKTTQQARGGQTLSLASATCDFIWIDEPPPPRVAGEIFARLARTKGVCAITCTPIGVPVEWLRKMVEDGRCSETVYPLTVENTTPKYCKPLLQQDEIDRIAANYLPIDRDARINGDWVAGIPEGRIFDQFREDLISDVAAPKQGNYRFGIGIDHGSDAGSQAAILVAVDVTEPNNPFVYVLDEYVAGSAPAEVHARGIMAMIRRNGLEIANVHRWTGDRAHGGKRSGGRMSNRMIEAAMCHVLGYPAGRLPFRIRTAYKPRFSVYYTCQAIHETMCKSRFQIYPRCKTLIKSITHWSLKASGGLDTMSEHKHTIDAMRYAIMPLINQQYRTSGVSKIAYR